MPIEVTMPRLSDTMEQGTVVKWNVKEGDKVKSGDVIADIETDKATMELQSYDDGTVAKLAVPEGQTVKVGSVILVLAGTGESVDTRKGAGAAAAAPAAAPAAKQADGATTTAPPAAGTAVMDRPRAGAAANSAAVVEPRGRIFASPLAKKIAEEAGLDLGRVEGTGPSGRITKQDVEAVIARGGPAEVLPAMPRPGAADKAAALAAAQVAPTPAVMVPPPGAMLTGRVVTLSNMRRTIAKRLVESKTSIPHYQVTVDAEMDALQTLRKQLNDQLESQGVKLSVNDFLVRACALAMHQHPFVNSRWVEPKGQDPAIEILADVNVGVAIALPEERGGGLVVGTLRNADRMGLRQISAQTKALAEKARTKGLTVEEMADSTFTISNLGMFGVSHFTAIINPPNAAILAVGGAIERPVVRNGQLAVGSVMSMTMSSDHRIVDGAMAAQYLATVRQMLEKPATLLV
jgi:pyruvate dehydrogenase E2 component (dihydrolipoamide acetyltransferase)